MLNSRFDIKDMGLANVIIGIKINRTSKEITLSQFHYIDKILEKFSRDDKIMRPALQWIQTSISHEIQVKLRASRVLKDHWKCYVLDYIY